MPQRLVAESLAGPISALVERVVDGDTIEVKLSHVVYDKYGGRVRASVADGQGDIAQALLTEGLARPYGGERRQPWCATG
jgi:endonuclease YncB( thermonuclease family)